MTAESSSKRIKTETGQLDVHKQSDGSPGTTAITGNEPPHPVAGPVGGQPLGLQEIAAHIAGHLQGISMLAQRMIAIDGAVEVSADGMSESGRTDDDLTSPTVSLSRDKLDGDDSPRIPRTSGSHGDSDSEIGVELSLGMSMDIKGEEVNMESSSAFNEDWSEMPTKHLEIDPENDPILRKLHKAQGDLEAVENAIRRSRSTHQSARIGKYAGSIDSADFEKLAHTALKTIYPDATHGLLEHLASSMTETYIVFHRLAFRNKHVQTSQRIAAKGLSEEPADGSVMVEIHDQPSNQVETNNITTGSRPTFQYRLNYGAIRTLALDHARQEAGDGQSEPTTLDSQEFRSCIRRFNPSATRKTKSILATRADYPQPPGRGETCNWCFQPFPNGLPQGEE